ncbi:MAG: CBS domain-containing protein [Pseudomonadota bacterium]
MPTSYQSPMAGDKSKSSTFSQSKSSNLSSANATVQNLLDGKDGHVFSIQPSETLGEAVKVLRDKRIGALMVTNGSGALTGILSERDIVRKLAETPGQTLPQLVEEVMTSTVVTCAPADTLVSVLRKMTDGRFRHMPVVAGETLVGMITIGDVVNFRLKELEYEALKLKQMIVG